MSFSLRTLLVAVLLAAFFTAALVYVTPLWATLVIMLTLGILTTGIVGLWVHRFNRTFWVPFCAVGWLYLLLALTPESINRLAQYLPSTRLSHALRRSDYKEALTSLGFDGELADLGAVSWTSFPIVALSDRSAALVTFGLFSDILHALFTLIAAAIAGLASLLLKQRSTSVL